MNRADGMEGRSVRTASERWVGAQHKFAFSSSTLLFRRRVAIDTGLPIISFTFDDFPRSAWLEGGRILERFGARGTYYASLGLMGSQGPHGPLFLAKDLEGLLETGHELGCHTFDHCNSWTTPAAQFERSIIKNRVALAQLLPGASFMSFAYPFCAPRPWTKRRVAKHFVAGRGGGFTLNTGHVDLNFLRAYFLEKIRGDPQAAKDIIDRNCRERGWLIFATHDVSPSPSRGGCTPRFFEEVVRYAVNSGARVLPVARAWEALRV